METIRVNMTPCEDIKTIHASQNDNEAREWGFELHNNGEKIDSSSISDQLVFKAYEGGTEEILPTNGSTPTTSPFKGNIKYPQGLLSDQEFLYRESPTEEDGLAKITDIKGNTLVWNQLVQNGNFVSKSAWIESDATYSVSNNVATVTASAQYGCIQAQTNYKAHKYLVCCDLKLTTASSYQQISLRPLPSVVITGANTTEWQHLARIFTATEGTFYYPRIIDTRTTGFDAFYVKNVMLFDLTQMGLDSIANTSEFTSLFSLPYYAYNQGTLISFMGNGIKTVGKNLIEGISQGAVGTHGETNTNANRLRVDGFVRVLQGEQYTFSASKSASTNLQIYTRFFADNDGSEQISYLDWLTLPRTITIPNGINYATFTIRYQTSTAITPSDIYDVQLEIGASATSYEPYTSSTLSLPISTYFPNGMDGVGDAYDELTNSGYAKRMGRIDLGSITYTREQSSQVTGVYFFVGAYHSIPNIKNRPNSVVWNIKTPLYEVVNSTSIYQGFAQNKTIGGYDAQTVRIRDDSFTDATAFKNSLSGQYLVFELATPTETSFTTASLVTENAEIPLSNEDGVLIGKCTEQLSENPGFFDAKIKLADDDGECYSNKIQLHVERSPQ